MSGQGHPMLGEPESYPQTICVEGEARFKLDFIIGRVLACWLNRERLYGIDDCDGQATLKNQFLRGGEITHS